MSSKLSFFLLNLGNFCLYSFGDSVSFLPGLKSEKGPYTRQVAKSGWQM